jgi:hypothetical protein
VDFKAYEEVLKSAGRRDPYEFVARAFGDTSAPFLGGLATAFVANTISNEWTRLGLFLAVVALVALLFIVFLRLLRSRVPFIDAGRRRVIFWTGLVVTIALAAVGGWALFGLHFPALREDRSTPGVSTTSSNPVANR